MANYLGFQSKTFLFTSQAKPSLPSKLPPKPVPAAPEALRVMGDTRIVKADIRSLQCPHCAGPLAKDMETSRWTIPPLIRDSFSMIGSAVGGTAGAFYGFNYSMPIVRKWIKGPMWLHFLVGAPPVIVFSSACAGLTGGSVPALAQLVSSSYHVVVSSAPPRPPSS